MTFADFSARGELGSDGALSEASSSSLRSTILRFRDAGVACSIDWRGTKAEADMQALMRNVLGVRGMVKLDATDCSQFDRAGGTIV